MKSSTTKVPEGLLKLYMNTKGLFRSKRLQIISLVIGALGGFLYWKFIGCNSGTCPIKSVWYWTMLWGAVFGYLAGDITIDLIRKRSSKKLNE
jgi:hypothetical protein